jgi:hypothetical protein
MRFCSATAAPYSGQLELDVALAGVEVESQASNFLSSSILPGSHSLQLSFLPGLSYEPASVLFNGAVSFSVLAQTPLSWGGSTTFNGTILTPVSGSASRTSTGNQSTTTKAVGNATTANQASHAQATLAVVKILVPARMGDFRVYVNGSIIPGRVFNGSASLSPTDIYSKSGPLYSAALTVGLTGYSLDVKVKDSGGHPLQGVSIVVSGQGIPSHNG